jgi:NADPH-dependent 2,4-dienoyl-CoA reductase/sulfur reductase-like enzyme
VSARTLVLGGGFGGIAAAVELRRLPGTEHEVVSDGEVPFDLMVAVPPHRPPAVVADSGLAAGHGWIAVDPGTLATGHERVYAVGDVTLIRSRTGCRSRRQV